MNFLTFLLLAILTVGAFALQQYYIDESCQRRYGDDRVKKAIIDAQEMAQSARRRIRDPADLYMNKVFAIIFGFDKKVISLSNEDQYSEIQCKKVGTCKHHMQD